jgi:hypothetical protein
MTSLDRLSAISTAPDGTAWAVGNRCHDFTKCSTLILHWNGTAWTRAPSPSPSSGRLLAKLPPFPRGRTPGGGNHLCIRPRRPEI